MRFDRPLLIGYSPCLFSFWVDGRKFGTGAGFNRLTHQTNHENTSHTAAERKLNEETELPTYLA